MQLFYSTAHSGPFIRQAPPRVDPLDVAGSVEPDLGAMRANRASALAQQQALRDAGAQRQTLAGGDLPNGLPAYTFLAPPPMFISRSQSFPSKGADAFHRPVDFLRYSSKDLAHQVEHANDKHAYEQMLEADIRGALNRRQGFSGKSLEEWDSAAGFSNMAMFPAISRNPETTQIICRPYAACYASFKPSPRSIAHHPQWVDLKLDSSTATIKIDASMLGDVNCKKSVLSALNMTCPRDGSYIWLMPFDQATAESGTDIFAKEGGHAIPIGGASLGLAMIAAVLNMPRIAYTGFVRRLVPDYTDQGVTEAKAAELQFKGGVAQHLYAPMGPDTLPGPMSLTHTNMWKVAITRVPRSSDMVETVDGLPFKVAWSIATRTPLVIPNKSEYGEVPMSKILESDKFKGQHFLLATLPLAYSMVQAEEGLPYHRNASPILLACTVSEAALLGSYADLYYRVEGNTIKRGALRNEGALHALQRQDLASIASGASRAKSGSKRAQGITKRLQGKVGASYHSTVREARGGTKRAKKILEKINRHALKRQNKRDQRRSGGRAPSVDVGGGGSASASRAASQARGASPARSQAPSSRGSSVNREHGQATSSQVARRRAAEGRSGPSRRSQALLRDLQSGQRTHSNMSQSQASSSFRSRSRGGSSSHRSNKSLRSKASGSFRGSKASSKLSAKNLQKHNKKQHNKKKRSGSVASSSSKRSKRSGGKASSSAKASGFWDTLKSIGKVVVPAVGLAGAAALGAKKFMGNSSSLPGDMKPYEKDYHIEMMQRAAGKFKKGSGSRAGSSASKRSSKMSSASKRSGGKKGTKVKKTKKGGVKKMRAAGQFGKKRKLNGYMTFVKTARPLVVKKMGKDAKQTMIVKELGKMWRGLSQAERDKYNAKAAAAGGPGSDTYSATGSFRKKAGGGSTTSSKKSGASKKKKTPAKKKPAKRSRSAASSKRSSRGSSMARSGATWDKIKHGVKTVGRVALPVIGAVSAYKAGKMLGRVQGYREGSMQGYERGVRADPPLYKGKAKFKKGGGRSMSNDSRASASHHRSVSQSRGRSPTARTRSSGGGASAIRQAPSMPRPRSVLRSKSPGQRSNSVVRFSVTGKKAKASGDWESWSSVGSSRSGKSTKLSAAALKKLEREGGGKRRKKGGGSVVSSVKSGLSKAWSYVPTAKTLVKLGLGVLTGVAAYRAANSTQGKAFLRSASSTVGKIRSMGPSGMKSNAKEYISRLGAKALATLSGATYVPKPADITFEGLGAELYPNANDKSTQKYGGKAFVDMFTASNPNKEVTRDNLQRFFYHLQQQAGAPTEEDARVAALHQVEMHAKKMFDLNY